MTSSRRQLLALLSFVFVLSLTALSQHLMQTPFKTRGESTIVVPVLINGAGPFDFMLDTGTTNTIIDRKLAEELHLPLVGKGTVATFQNEAVIPVVHAGSISLAGANVHGMDIFAITNFAIRTPHVRVRGTLGEDFMRHFDVLIDNTHRLLSFELGPGPLGQTLAGERLTLSLESPSSTDPTENRLIVTGRCFQPGDRDVKLQLDSGVSNLVLFSMPSIWPDFQSATVSVEGPLGIDIPANLRTAHLRLGKKLFTQTAIVPESNISPRGAEVDGLLPTSLFRSIFISHSGRFVILDPSPKPALAQSRPPLAQKQR